MVFKSFSKKDKIMRRYEERELVRQIAYQIIDGAIYEKKKLLVCSDEIFDKTGIDQLRAGLFLSMHYQEWGLGRTNVSPYHLQNVWAYFRKAENGSIGTDTLIAINELKEKLKKEREERKIAKQKELAEKRAKQKAIRKSEDLSQRIGGMIDNLHKEKGKVNFTDIRLELRNEFGKIPDGNILALALGKYEKGIKGKRYVWNKEEGYSTMPT
jgi:hypothetical protein